MKIPEEKLVRPSHAEKIHFPYANQADSYIYGNRNKLGGNPDWIQNDETPRCPLCYDRMTFYGQLDSINDSIMIEDVGMIYVFYCFHCGIVHALSQSN